MSSATSTVDLVTCESEPIHIPGRVQPHGALLAVSEPDGVVVQTSANCAALLGLPELPLGRPLADVLGRDLTAALAAPDPRPLAPLPVSVGGRAFDVIAHRHAGRLIVELEPAAGGTTADPDRLVRFTLANLRNGLHLQPFCEVVAREVRALTGYDRVMVYRFDPDWNGEVYAEVKRDDLEPFLGLHYPASDIPAQARRLYHLNLVRHIPDITYASSALVPELDPGTGAPLDLSHAVLRSVSPIHVEYLKNMDVAGTLTISLLKDGRLWGLVACHHYAPLFLPYRVRAACESLGVLVSLQLSAKQDAEDLRCRAAAQERLGRLAAALIGDDPVAVLAEQPDDLIGLTRAAGAAVVSGGRVTLAGATPGAEQAARVAQWLRDGNRGEYDTHALPAAVPGTDPATASGLLAVPLGGGDYLLWFRPELIASVRWAGDPHYKRVVTGPNGPRLSPRGSFALWREEQREKSEPWGACDREAAHTLRGMVLAALARRGAGLEAEARRRDAFLAAVAHELRNPIAPIQNAAHLVRMSAGGNPVAARAADMIERQTGALRRIVDDLLDASRAGQGKLRVDLAPLDLAPLVRAAAEDARAALEANGIALEARTPAAPVRVRGDAVRLRQVLSNLLTNAGKFTDRGGRVTVALGADEGTASLSVADTGIGIAAADLRRVFQAFAQAEGALERSREGLGLGLALVRSIAELHGGSAAATSAGLGHGTTFTVRLPLDTPAP
ncbi:ATP-binding protein [Gemmata sp. JC673]|uniref:histidine kinase n=1 Tax=Gemmata algarum TaxID=2975278 RepID=A0ABU5EY31_9BACT|nr:ATP-binding protein [Gemmata algarum]MDY3558596.1 ATP-binding protein [Gemmata algarum]